MATQLVANPSGVSFGVIRARVLPLTQQIQLTNIGSTPLTLSVVLNRLSAENNAQTSVSPAEPSTLAAGQTAGINVMLSGTVPFTGYLSGLRDRFRRGECRQHPLSFRSRRRQAL